MALGGFVKIAPTKRTQFGCSLQRRGASASRVLRSRFSARVKGIVVTQARGVTRSSKATREIPETPARGDALISRVDRVVTSARIERPSEILRRTEMSVFFRDDFFSRAWIPRISTPPRTRPFNVNTEGVDTDIAARDALEVSGTAYHRERRKSCQAALRYSTGL